MYQIIIVIHVLLGLGIIGLILIQQGKGADAGASFGTGGSASVFGAQGAGSFLSRTTATLATFFFITSLGLAIMNGRQGAAYDLMGAEEAKKGEVGIPQVDNSKIPEAPIVAPEAKLPDQPLTPASPALNQAIEKMQEAPIPVATPEAAPAEAKPAKEQPAAPAEEIKNTVVPKADAIKTVEPIAAPAEVKPATKTTEKPKKTVKKKKPVDKKDGEKK